MDFVNQLKIINPLANLISSYEVTRVVPDTSLEEQ